MLNAGVDAKSAGNDTVPSDLPTSFLSRNFRLRGEELNRAHIVVTCNRRSFVSEFIHVRSIQDRMAEESWELKMRRSSLVALSSLLFGAIPTKRRASFLRTCGNTAQGIKPMRWDHRTRVLTIENLIQYPLFRATTRVAII